jgi:hypothetical protein
MGRKFRAPKKNDLKEWKKIEILMRAGFRTGAHSISGLTNYPSDLHSVPEFIHKNWGKRCASCMKYIFDHFGECPQNEKEIELFISKWF